MAKNFALSSAILLVTVVLVSNFRKVDAFIPNSGAYTPNLSYFFGVRPAGNVLCFERTIPKGTTTPVNVYYTNPVAAGLINFVTVNADRYAKYGFRVSILSGALGTVTLNFQLTGKAVLPYNVVFQYWCV
ncbi:conserved hypothetical protein [Culex quinquefasciatus]|uniref:Uncharacterized protein n=1 Tax=Culex quinquefasciatus TaxID=7176 RepID=B0XIR5_CULQU|nr:conserved hypothetical protein [Culex quinquefasciatus]|eukprot:XP_001869537.1 conserved hypothetical protein [Culex quinquefasciatus]